MSQSLMLALLRMSEGAYFEKLDPNSTDIPVRDEKRAIMMSVLYDALHRGIYGWGPTPLGAESPGDAMAIRVGTLLAAVVKSHDTDAGLPVPETTAADQADLQERTTRFVEGIRQIVNKSLERLT